MRKSLVAAVALAPLCFAVSHRPAFAQVTVSNSGSTPLATATANNGAADDIDLTGSVSLGTSASGVTPVLGVPTTAGVTINSNNALTNSGSITLNAVNQTTSAGVYATQGTSISNVGTITNSESYTASDTVNGDGIVEAPFADPANTGLVGSTLVNNVLVGGTLDQRYGILLTGSGLSGALSNTGTITLQGNDSFGIAVEAPVLGGLINAGTITITGDNNVGLYTSAAGTVTGGLVANASTNTNAPSGILISGAITSTGQNSSAVSINGAVNGAITVYSSLTSTGFSTTTRSSSDTELYKIENTPTDVQQSAATMIVGASVTQGILIGAPPVSTSTSTALTVDLDGDGISDVDEGTSAINIYGSAPGLLIGSTSNPITIGDFGSTDGEDSAFGTTPNAYGLIVRGSINAFGTYDGVSATALQIGGPITTTNYQGVTTTANSQTVNFTDALGGGGVRIVGSVNASTYDATATAISIGAGAIVPNVVNQDFIASTISHSTLATVTPLLSIYTATPEPTSTAYGILIGTGATVGTINNVGTISAAATGDNASAVAIRDLSGTVANVINQGVIESQIAAGVVGDATTGSIIALDLSANTTGVNLTQSVNDNPINIYVSTTTSASGTTTTTAATSGTVLGSTVTKTTTTASTITTTVTTTAAGVTTTAASTTPTTPEIVGDVLLGTGANNVQLLGGSIFGALDLGGSPTSSAQATFNVSGAAYEGALTYQGNALALSVNGANVVSSTGSTTTGTTTTTTNTTTTTATPATLIDTSTSRLNLSSLNVGASGVSTGTIYFAVNPAATGTTPQATLFKVNGTATIGAGAQFGIDLLSTAPTSQTYTVVAANALNLTGAPSGQALLADVPYLVNATVTTNTTLNTISLTLSDKTAQQLGLNLGQSQALNAVLAALPNDASIQSALLTTYSKTSFLGVYNQLLPDYAGGVFQLAAAGSDAITRATSRSNDIENPAGTRGAWAEEFAFGVNRAALGATGYRGDGFGFVGGLETGGAGFGAFGVTGSFLTGTLTDPHAPGDGQQSISEGEFGTYWQGQFGGFKADARVAGGFARFSDQREIYETDSTGAITLDRTAKGASDGWTATGHFGGAYQWDIGRWFIRPAASADYFRLDEGGYTENGAASTTQSTINSSGATVDSDGVDLQLANRTGYQATGAASLTIGRTIGTTFVWRPQVEIGYRDAFAGTAGDTTARFVQGGSNFTMTPLQITGGGPTARLGAKADTDFYELDFEAGAEERNNFYEADVRFNIRVLF
jgi:hypothetical protein